jgi:hypothetical protein
MLDEAWQISLKLEDYDFADPARNDHSVPVSYHDPNRFMKFVRPVHDNYEDEKSSQTKENPVSSDQLEMIKCVLNNWNRSLILS